MSGDVSRKNGRSPVLPLLPAQRGRGGNRGMNRGEEWLFSSVFSVQKETEEAGDKAIAYYSEYVRMPGGSRRESAGGREWLHCPNQTGQRLPRGLKEQWEWRQHWEKHCWELSVPPKGGGTMFFQWEARGRESCSYSEKQTGRSLGVEKRCKGRREVIAGERLHSGWGHSAKRQ